MKITTSKKLNSTILSLALLLNTPANLTLAHSPKDAAISSTNLQIQQRNPFSAPANPSICTQNDITLITNPSESSKAKDNLLIIKLNYALAKDIEKSLKNIFGADKLSVDTITNAILFKGTKSEGHRLQEAIKALDVATKQVTLEAKIIALNKEASKSLGVNWNWDKIPQNDSQQNENSYDDENSNNFGGNFKFWRGYAFKFNATLNALIANGKAKLLATPSIITIPGKEASIFIGDHIPVQTEKHNSSGSYTTTEYLDAGIKLTYTPIVSNDGKMVTATVHTEVSTPTLVSEMKNYRITSRTADTNVRMLTGETLVIGGLINEEEQRSIQKVPLLSNIPLFGELFKNRSKRKVKTEVIMLLTPHITGAGESPAIYKERYSSPLIR
jgi:protein transport protein HofQ/type IV pilus assembly protein PilQ